MSQQFGADAVANTTATTLTNGAQVQVALGNFVNPPYGNCKFKILAQCALTLGSVPTSVKATIVRNPTGDNTAIVDTSVLTAGVAANGQIEVFVAGVDQVPDGRPCQYQLLILCQGTGTNGTSARAYIEATCLSG